MLIPLNYISLLHSTPAILENNLYSPKVYVRTALAQIPRGIIFANFSPRLYIRES